MSECTEPKTNHILFYFNISIHQKSEHYLPDLTSLNTIYLISLV